MKKFCPANGNLESISERREVSLPTVPESPKEKIASKEPAYRAEQEESKGSPKRRFHPIFFPEIRLKGGVKIHFLKEAADGRVGDMLERFPDCSDFPRYLQTFVNVPVWKLCKTSFEKS